MARLGLGLRAAALEVGVELTVEEAELIQRRKSFGALLWTARNRYHQEVAGDPERTKKALIGALYILAQRLSEEGESDKAAEVLLKVAKIEGWVGPDSNVNVFGNLSSKDYNDLRKTFESRLEKNPPCPPTPPSLN